MRRPHASQGRPPPHCAQRCSPGSKTPSAGNFIAPVRPWYRLPASLEGSFLCSVPPRYMSLNAPSVEATQPSSCWSSCYVAPALTRHRCCKKQCRQIPVSDSAHLPPHAQEARGASPPLSQVPKGARHWTRHLSPLRCPLPALGHLPQLPWDFQSPRSCGSQTGGTTPSSRSGLKCRKHSKPRGAPEASSGAGLGGAQTQRGAPPPWPPAGGEGTWLLTPRGVGRIGVEPRSAGCRTWHV